MRLPAAAALALVLLAAGCSHHAEEPQSAATTAPNAPEAAFKYVLTPPAPAPGAPAILEIAISDATIHPGASYTVRVTTTPNVLTVTAQAQGMGGSYALVQSSPGHFTTTGDVPREIPFFLLNRSYTVMVTAETADGHSTSVPVSLRLER